MKKVFIIEVVAFCTNKLDPFKAKYFRTDMYDSAEEANEAIPKIAEETKGFYKEAKFPDEFNFLFRVEEFQHYQLFSVNQDLQIEKQD